MENTKIILSDEEYNSYLNKLNKLELSRIFCKHTLVHFIDVARICTILALEEGLDISRDMIYATALLHDIGRVEQIEKGIPHELASAKIAERILERTLFNSDEKKRILSCIKSHRNKNEEDIFEEIFYRADKLSRLCFNCSATKECNWSETRKNKTVIY